MEFIDSDPTLFRKSISNYFGKLLDNESLGKNIEVGIYNYSIQDANTRQIIKKWKNIKFAEIYSCRLRTILHNLKNEELLNQLKTSQIMPKAFALMSHQEMAPDKWKTMIELKMKRDKSRLSTNIEASTDLFICKKCKSQKCTYYEMQVRSADEPATIFITCLDCGKNWKN
jgi:DNA-directed RNA polymerase subunit M/transcription elongation factor TFIIS